MVVCLLEGGLHSHLEHLFGLLHAVSLDEELADLKKSGDVLRGIFQHLVELIDCSGEVAFGFEFLGVAVAEEWILRIVCHQTEELFFA